MANIVLICGEPGNGKSFASIILKSIDCCDSVLHTDEIYVGYVYTQKQDIYNDNLRRTIMSHYQTHRAQIQKEWHSHLFGVVQRDADRVKRLLLEGWQLFDCLSEMEAHLKKKGHNVLTVMASGRQYFPSPQKPHDVMELAHWIQTHFSEPKVKE